MASKTLDRVSSDTGRGPLLITYETVEGATPARRATSFRVTFLASRTISLLHIYIPTILNDHTLTQLNKKFFRRAKVSPFEWSTRVTRFVLLTFLFHFLNRTVNHDLEF
jgi:hypothetical protein